MTIVPNQQNGVQMYGSERCLKRLKESNLKRAN